MVASGHEHTILLCENGNVYSTFYYGNKYDNYGQNGFGSIMFNDVNDYGFHRIPYFKHKTIKQIAAGFGHSLFLDYENILWGYGYNKYGQLGLGHTNPSKDKLPAANDYFSSNKHIIITQISCGAHHNLILDDNGNVYSFGYNRYGQCGVGESESSKPILISKTNMVQIKCGDYHSYIGDESNNYYLFGSNKYNEVTLKPYPTER